jgi:AraC-like DNA-binding protein
MCEMDERQKEGGVRPHASPPPNSGSRAVPDTAPRPGLSSSSHSLHGNVVVQRVARDRVEQRRRAAALARHYRDQENLTIAEIARRLGRAEATVKAYLYDPS